MRVVWRYPVPNPGAQITHSIPEGSRVLTVREENLRSYIWVEVPDSQAPRIHRQFVSVAPGQPLPEESVHIGFVELHVRPRATYTIVEIQDAVVA